MKTLMLLDLRNYINKISHKTETLSKDIKNIKNELFRAQGEFKDTRREFALHIQEIVKILQFHNISGNLWLDEFVENNNHNEARILGFDGDNFYTAKVIATGNDIDYDSFIGKSKLKEIHTIDHIFLQRITDREYINCIKNLKDAFENAINIIFNKRRIR